MAHNVKNYDDQTLLALRGVLTRQIENEMTHLANVGQEINRRKISGKSDQLNEIIKFHRETARAHGRKHAEQDSRSGECLKNSDAIELATAHWEYVKAVLRIHSVADYIIREAGDAYIDSMYSGYLEGREECKND